ncbi:MAG: hypothetical protein M1832_000920 [Thelocarpon impressellum]|nr:MAG: hypothetical protein M1832_000920 [Thelocarpon impressellum]
MAFTFTRSREVIQQLENELQSPASLLPPSQTALERVDEDLAVIGKSMLQGFRRADIRSDVVDRRFDAVDRRFDDVDGLFEAVDRRFRAVDQQLDDMKARGYNSLANRGWSPIYLPRMQDSDGSYQLPKYGPREVKHFWLDKLIYLVHFYKINGQVSWLNYDDMDDYFLPAALPHMTEEDVGKGVRADPERALQALAIRLGLKYDHISAFMTRADQMAETDSGSSGKAIVKKREPTAADIPEPAQRASKPPKRQTLHGSDERSTPSTVLLWDPK